MAYLITRWMTEKFHVHPKRLTKNYQRTGLMIWQNNWMMIRYFSHRKDMIKLQQAFRCNWIMKCWIKKTGFSFNCFVSIYQQRLNGGWYKIEIYICNQPFRFNINEKLTVTEDNEPSHQNITTNAYKIIQAFKSSDPFSIAGNSTEDLTSTKTWNKKIFFLKTESYSQSEIVMRAS